MGLIFKAAMDGYASDKIHQELVSEEEFSVSDNFPMLMVFQIGVFFKAAMDGYASFVLGLGATGSLFSYLF